jgi:hypothetical protein
MQLSRAARPARQALRAEVLAGDSADQAKVSALLDRALRIQRQRLDIAQREQRDLAAFMTPVQRAMYVAIQDDLRRRLEDFRQQRRQGAHRVFLGGEGGPRRLRVEASREPSPFRHLQTDPFPGISAQALDHLSATCWSQRGRQPDGMAGRGGIPRQGMCRSDEHHVHSHAHQRAPDRVRIARIDRSTRVAPLRFLGEW